MALQKMVESVIGSKVVLPVILDVKINVWAAGAVRGHQSKQNAIALSMMKWLARNEERQDLQASECRTVFFLEDLFTKLCSLGTVRPKAS